MSLFVAIPSALDLKKGFSRLKLWQLKSEWIYIAEDGKARKADPDLAVSSGLILVSLTYLKQIPTLKDGPALIGRADGVFIHPGGTDTPDIADAARALEDIPIDLRYQILSKAVSFTRSGAGDYQVDQLTRVWNWMSSNPQKGEELRIPDFNLSRVASEFGRLRGKQGRDAIARACLLAQGSLDNEVAENVRARFTDELRRFLEEEGEASWMQRDNRLGPAAKALLGGGPTQENVSEFLKEVRAHFGEEGR